ncbi:MAG: hypothetical protein E3K37_17445 [Candidatus Kuenenia sp.]|nr:hypothetical protein [Candidatus Kuenenia hertensis]
MNTKRIRYTSHVSECAFIAYFFILTFFPYDADVFKISCLLTMVGCLTYQMVCEKRIVFEKTALNIPILAFFICLITSSIFSKNTKYCFETLLHDYVKYFIIFFCMVNTIHSIDQIKRIVKAMLITCGLVCGYGVYGYYTGIAIRDDRLIATFEYHSRIAKYISLFLPIAICLFFYYRNVFVRICLSGLILVSGYSLILTMNRTSWVANLIAVFYIAFALKKKYLLFAIIALCPLLFVLLPSKYSMHAKTITQYDKFFSSNKILGERLMCWKVSIAVIRDYPLLGLGPGKRNFREVYKTYRKEIKKKEKESLGNNAAKTVKRKKKVNTKKVQTVEGLSHAHNIILHLWVEAGIFGLAIFLWMFTRIFYIATKTRKSINADRFENFLLVGVTAGLVSIVFHGLTDIFWKTPESLFLWYVIGVLFLVVHCVLNSQRKDVTSISFRNS